VLAGPQHPPFVQEGLIDLIRRELARVALVVADFKGIRDG
jgi:hypothetical protein